MSVEVGRFHDLHEAELAAALLRSAGIAAEVADHHLIAMDPLMQRAVGGLRVMTPPHQADDARAILDQAAAGAFAADEDDGPDDLPPAAPSAVRDLGLMAGVLAAPWAAAGMLGGRRSVSRRRRLAPLAITLLVAVLVIVPLLLRLLG